MKLPAGVHFAQDAPLREGDTFEVPVDRLALTTGGDSLLPFEAPCPPRDDRLPCTTVNATKRVIVGVTGAPAPDAHGLYAYDVQVNNARNAPIAVTAHEWTLSTDDGEVLDVVRGSGVGGHTGQKGRDVTVQSDTAFRFQGNLECPDPYEGGCVATGQFTVTLLGTGQQITLSTGDLALRADCARS